MKDRLTIGAGGILAGLLLGFLLFRGCDASPVEILKVERIRDTTIIIREGVNREVVRLIPFSRPQRPEDSADHGTITPAMTDSCPDPYVDSLRIVEGDDSVDIAYAYPQRTFAYRWQRPQDTTRISTNTTETTTVQAPRHPTLGLGFIGGYGLDPLSGTWRAVIGIGASFQLVEIR